MIANTGLAKVAVQCSAETFVFNQSLVLLINICGEYRQLRQARKRYWQVKNQQPKDKYLKKMTNKYSSTYPAKKSASFENFISVDTNTTAKSTAIEFALSVTPYNVLGISSTIGNGATHLALAILNKIEALERGKEVFYSSFERLISNNSKNNELTIFNKEFLNSKSLILIDSFYESSNKEISNKIVDVLKNVNTKIIFTYNEGTKVPIVQKEINISRPSVIEKEIIIKQLLKSEKMDLCSESINYIGGLSNLGVREIEGLIICICAKRALGDTTPDIQIVNNLLNSFINNN